MSSGPDQWPGPPPWSAPPPSSHTASAAAQTAEKTGETTEETAETTAETAAKPTRHNRYAGTCCARLWSAQDKSPWWLDRTHTSKRLRITEDRLRLERTDSRFPLDHKMLNLIRRADPLRHVVENLSAVTEREAKILHIIGLADKAKLRADASWRDLQSLGRAHSVKARNDLYNEAA